MLQPPTEGKFQTLEIIWKHAHNVARAQGYALSTLRSNMTHNQIVIGCYRSGTPKPNKNSSKIVTSRKIDCPFRLFEIKYSKKTTWTPKVKSPEHRNDETENIMEHPAFRKLNEKETSQIAQMSESLLLPRKIKAQLCSQRESERPVILQDIYNKVKKIKKDKLQGRWPIYALIDTLKEENFVWSSARDSERHLTSLFFTHPLVIKILHGFPCVILMDCTYKPNKYKMPLFHIVGFSSTNKTFSGAFCLMKNETEPLYTWELNKYIERVLSNTNIVPPPDIVINRDLDLKSSLKKLFIDSKTGCQGDYQSVEKERKKEAKKIFEEIGEDLFQRLMAEITPILHHFQDFLTGKFPFDQIPKSKEDDQYYEDPL
ncbi:hypothetical protein O181_070151 [Austropuccinia psidii MF-1]|uniref:MULE transposase domain-containing protein n=1 Tax=Austropuccinia psidii MF-1 TaxID=1389203 RepID=A0A9Q3F4U3_9BASI|nr:hypothetical protein [Austropuccinia psidii MF-1]